MCETASHVASTVRNQRAMDVVASMSFVFSLQSGTPACDTTFSVALHSLNSLIDIPRDVLPR